jgi:hypothetical protein
MKRMRRFGSCLIFTPKSEACIPIPDMIILYESLHSQEENEEVQLKDFVAQEKMWQISKKMFQLK